MRKIVLIIVAFLMISTFSYYNVFVSSDDNVATLSFTSNEQILIEELTQKEFVIADQYSSGYTQQLTEELNSVYGFNFKVKQFDDYEKIYQALKSDEIDFAFDISFKLNDTDDYDLEFSNSYITNSNTLYFDGELSNMESLDKVIYCRNEEMCEVFKAFGIAYKDMVIESDISVVIEHLGTVDNSFYYDYNVVAPKMLERGMATQHLDKTIDYLPLHFVASKNGNEKYLNVLQKIYTSKTFYRNLSQRLNVAKNDAKIVYLKKEYNFDDNKTYKVFFNDLYPFAYHQDGSWKGAYVDAVLNFYKDMNLDYQVLNLNKELPEGEYLSKLYYDEIDVIAPLGVVENRKEKVLFSDTEYYVDLVAIKRDTYTEEYYDYAEMYNEKIGIFNTGVDYELPRTLMSGKEFKVYDSYYDLFNALMSKEINYVICTRKYYEQYVSETKEYSIIVDNTLGTFGGVSVVVAFNNSEEGQLIRDAFSFWSDEEHINKQIEHINMDTSPVKYFRQREFVINTLFMIMVALVASIAVVFFTTSRYDGLTKVKNRTAFTSAFRKVIPQGLTLLYVDLNKFKLINDTYGHSAGDLVLTAFANKSKKYDHLEMYRMGGDEFVVVTNLKKSNLSVQELVDDFGEVAVLSPDTDIIFKVTASLGHMYLDKPMQVDRALEYVDYAMYRSKSEDGVLVDVNDDFITEIDAERKVITRITDAFDKQNIKIMFNPVVNVKTKAVETFMVDQYWDNGGTLEHIEKRIDFIKQIGLIEQLDIINLNRLIGAYNQLLHEECYDDQTFTVSMTESTFERTVKHVIGENKAIDLFFANQLLIRVENDSRLSKVSSALLQEFSKRGVMIDLEDLNVREDISELMENVSNLFLIVDKSVLIESSEQYLLYNAMTDKINDLKANGALLLVTGVDDRVDFAKVNQFDIDYVMGKYISEQLESDQLKKFLEEKKYQERLVVRQKLRK